MKHRAVAQLGLLGSLVSCSTAPAISGNTGGTVAGVGGTTNTYELPVVETPWTETVLDYECAHVRVEKDCRDGWCRIPAGCFIAGSPETEPGHGPLTEARRPILLTRSFVMQQTEVTQAAWLELVSENPSGQDVESPMTHDPVDADCLEPDCPVGHVNWWEAAEYANRLSRREGRQECFVLKNCVGTPGMRPDAGEIFNCDKDYELTTPTVYECAGYRLPTDAEYEYAARAGARTTYYSGDLAEEFRDECTRILPHLDAIAWYCANAENRSHPVGKKLPNGWGLFDVHGNAFEWNHNRTVMPNPGESPWRDPYGTTGNEVDVPGSLHEIKGGDFRFRPGVLRVAGRSALFDDMKGVGIGFRLVRTLAEGEE